MLGLNLMVDKTKQPDGTWILQVTLTCNNANSPAGLKCDRMIDGEVTHVVDLKFPSGDEPQIQHLDWR